MKTTLLLSLVAYAALLGLSWAKEEPVPAASPGTGPGRVAVEIRPQDDLGPLDLGLDGPRATLSFLHWSAVGASGRPPLVCLHGSPGSARNFEDLGPRLARAGWDVWALDLPGFGRSVGPVGGHSIRAHANATLQALDALGIERFHLLAWSMGGGVALHVADLHPERTASLSLVASIGVQEAEGSGNYAIEHLKYLALRSGLFLLDRGVPHFGKLGRFHQDARAFALNFWETDQRPLRGILQRLAVPTFIAHGREDFLAPSWAAEESHALVATSRLALYDASHFLPISEPFGQAGLLLEELEPFLARHDEPGHTEAHVRVSPGPQPEGWRLLEPEAFAFPRRVPWWLLAFVLALAAYFKPFQAAVLTGVWVASLQLDFGLAALAAAPGTMLRTRVDLDRARHGLARLLALCLAPLRFLGWMLVPMVLSGLVGGLLPSGMLDQAPRAIVPLVLGVGVVLLHDQIVRWRLARAPEAQGPAPAGPA